MNIVLVHLGSKIPDYFKFCIEQFRVFNPAATVYLISQNKYLTADRPLLSACSVTPVPAEELESDSRIRTFRKKHWFKKWGTPETIYPSAPNYWQYTTERLFFISAFMRRRHVGDVFHFENDVLIYRDLAEIKRGIDRIQPRWMIVPEGPQLNSCALFYAADPGVLTEFCDFVLSHTSKSEAEIHLQYGIDSVNDMTLLKIFADRGGKIDYFPILPRGGHAAHIDVFGSIFDGTALGQFMGGSNNGHPPGWAGNHHYVGTELLAGNYDLIWETADGLNVPFVLGRDGEKTRLNNLHIHNKQLQSFVSKSRVPAVNDKLLQEILESFDVRWLNTHSRGDTLTPEEQLRRDKPRPFLLKAIDIFKQRGGKRIVEIGTSSWNLFHALDEDGAKWGEHCCNSGHSTFFLALSGAEEVWTVDNNPDAARLAQKNLAEHEYTKHCRNVRFVTQDALEFLKHFDKPIDLLYLDGWDIAPDRYAENHLAAYLLAKKNLHPDSLILIDDTDLDRGGKGKRVVPQAVRDGYRIVFQGRQTLLIHASSKLAADFTPPADFKFEYETNDFATHQPILYHMIKMTQGPILELGCGSGSTPLLHHFAKGRKILSVETHPAWFEPLRQKYEDENHEFLLVSDWDEFLNDRRLDEKWSFVFVDQHPWEGRHKSILKLKDRADYIVLHDADYFAREGVFGVETRPILPFLDEGKRNYDDMFRFWKEFFPRKPWIVDTGPPTLVGSNSKPCDFNVSFYV